MNDPARDIRGAVAAHRALAADLAGLTDEQARRPSELADWTVGHVLTHIARNADGLSNMLEGAARGVVAEMYPGGHEGRAADIAAGAPRPAAELVDDVATSSARIEAAFLALGDDRWDAQGATVFGPIAMREVPRRRWQEVTVHHSDLGLGFTRRDWPDDFVRLELQRFTMLWNSRKPMGLTGLPAAALAVDDHDRLAWLMGRLTIEGLEPAGLLG